MAYQEQDINALQSIYNNNEELLGATKEQTEILRKINETLTGDKLPKGN